MEIGAASRQELERIHAEHAAQTAAVESARAQLELLRHRDSSLEKGDVQKLSATMPIPAPIDGVITERSANVGLNVDPATRLLTVVDLSTVWVLADVTMSATWAACAWELKPTSHPRRFREAGAIAESAISIRSSDADDVREGPNRTTESVG